MIDISVLMAVYNESETYLRAAMESILNQTFSNFEFIIVNDCSDAATVRILNEYVLSDNRIVLIDNKKNIGLTKSLNKALKKAKGKYIARMDSDDISIKERFEKQFFYMERHPFLDVLGGVSMDLDSQSYEHGYLDKHTKRLETRLLFENQAIPHPTAFIRKSFLDREQIRYDETLPKSQDYGLWVECAPKGKIYSLPEVLLLKRNHEKQISSANKPEQIQCSHLIRIRQFQRIDSQITADEVEIIIDLVDGKKSYLVEEYLRVLKKVLDSNKRMKAYPQNFLKQEIFLYLFHTFKGSLGIHNMFLMKILIPSNFFYVLKIYVIDNYMKKRIINKFMAGNGLGGYI